MLRMVRESASVTKDSRTANSVDIEDESDHVQRSKSIARDNVVDILTGPEDDFISPSQSSGSPLSVLVPFKNLCTKAAGTPPSAAEQPRRTLAEAFDFDLLDTPSYNRMASFALLPSRERVQRMVSIALDSALNCQDPVDRERLGAQIDDLYERNADDYTQKNRQALGLVYALMALGRRYEPDAADENTNRGSELLVLKGVTYFRAARSIIDTSDTHDLDAVRTLVVMTVYLLSSSMISKAYTCICTAVNFSMRLGLHVSGASLASKFQNSELTDRRRVFAVLNLLDTYMSCILGLPNILRDADPSQIVPAPEEEMEDEGTDFVARNPFTPLSETILSAKLFRIEAEILGEQFSRDRYSVNDHGKHEIDYRFVANIEAKLQDWHEALPGMPPDSLGDQALKSQIMLRFCHAAVQLMLYRPFVHHVVRSQEDPDFNYKGYALGSSCIRTSMQAVWLVDAFDRHGYLHEALWQTIYILALAGSSLMLFVLGAREGSPTIAESRHAALKARELLGKLASKNISARRCFESLSDLPESAPARPPTQEDTSRDASPHSRFMMGIGAAVEPAATSVTPLVRMSTADTENDTRPLGQQ
ncbi:hypothetical protein CLAFUW4_12869 [Fulvia fulva]|uniref:Xylanolytic transcriptional activator regulatory domain-containing protein n=1 Tax=Passalora fulva TaxID=5499 RepID=A0A9Q8PJ92_PASFU|nr:uncharacterized protein CLAFUR5_12735 [Fulvia fulva]KAK4612288.1 hypothetical protein CLAFUR4_12873 [Fulvia fulva]KAK4612941.1 hypothetical protein CLAFUR0_12879 [Fulvia fulva]UJO23556.1 hypothetical protein CLAFUR5_12735 [Fulvia fulva]WPV21186.1 hypothetical protein CLAFUW4_12869 [Fulvia fulva]WPV36476.1 hypothetical protein CLAFUW7_12876 [Fulvia fulva]